MPPARWSLPHRGLQAIELEVELLIQPGEPPVDLPKPPLDGAKPPVERIKTPLDPVKPLFDPAKTPRESAAR